MLRSLLSSSFIDAFRQVLEPGKSSKAQLGWASQFIYAMRVLCSTARTKAQQGFQEKWHAYYIYLGSIPNSGKVKGKSYSSTKDIESELYNQLPPA